ncbi:unnamed protein product [Rotaria socialis]
MGLSLLIVDHTSFNDFMNDVDSKYKPIHRHKIVRLITDNASNNLAAFDNIILPGFDDYFDGIIDDSSESESKSKSNDKETDDYAPAIDSATEEEFLRLPCFCHCLQLVVNDGIKASAAAVSSLQKVASLAKLSHSSTVSSERLEKFNYTIPRANCTRWNSQFQTVKKVVDIPSSILNSILSDLKKNDLILNSKDRKVLEEFVSLFELFNEATLLTQGESYATICLVAPTVLGIYCKKNRIIINEKSVYESATCSKPFSTVYQRVINPVINPLKSV